MKSKEIAETLIKVLDVYHELYGESPHSVHLSLVMLETINWKDVLDRVDGVKVFQSGILRDDDLAVYSRSGSLWVMGRVGVERIILPENEKEYYAAIQFFEN